MSIRNPGYQLGVAFALLSSSAQMHIYVAGMRRSPTVDNVVFSDDLPKGAGVGTGGCP
ncbi:MAG: hypothetical protein NUV96_02635 [Candidatus Colwellbacteria bacterium]|nr:hypothetical protein [Candidatus Colwellbacteria bacterium]